MAISTTSLLRYLKRNLGASHRPLPISDEDIIDVVLEETLLTFSNYFPYTYNITVNAFNQVPGKSGQFFLEADGLEILGIQKVFTVYGNNSFIQGVGNSYVYPTDGMNNQLLTNLTSYTDVPTTFEFYPPNICEIYPKYNSSDTIMITLKCVHPDHLATIPLSLREQFYALALLDVKIALWNILKQYSGMSTAVGSIDLKIDDYEAATSERKDLLQLWDANYYKEPLRQKIWVG